jgi:hypothetical protein
VSSKDAQEAVAAESEEVQPVPAARLLVEPVQPPEAVALSVPQAVAAVPLVAQQPSVRQPAVFLRSSARLLPR